MEFLTSEINNFFELIMNYTALWRKERFIALDSKAILKSNWKLIENSLQIQTSRQLCSSYCTAL